MPYADFFAAGIDRVTFTSPSVLNSLRCSSYRSSAMGTIDCPQGGTVLPAQYPNGHVLDAVDEVGPQSDHVAGELHVGHAWQQLLEHHPHLEPGQRGAQAEVRAAGAEREVAVRRARDVEAERLGEDP